MPQQIYFIRHGLTDWNVQRRLQGHSDIPLNQQGRDQATELAQTFSLPKPDLIFSSDLQRAHQTAAILSTHWKKPVETSKHFREIFLGDAEGLTREKMLETLGDQFVNDWGQMHSDFHHIRPPKGETKQEAVERFHKQLQALSGRSNTLALVSHGLILRTYIHLNSIDGLEQDFYIPNLTCIHCEINWSNPKPLKLINVLKPKQTG